MALRLISLLTVKALKDVSLGFLSPAAINYETVRFRKTKHWLPKWKTMRKEKVMKVKLPNFEEKFEDLTEEQIRSKLKEQGILPPRSWNEKPFYISSTGAIFEAYVPPEGDGKVSLITSEGAKQNLDKLGKKSKTMLAVRKIRRYEEDFDSAKFCKHVTDIYTKVHQCMADQDTEKVIDYVTERAYPEVIHNIKNKTIRWKYIKDIEPPRIVHARCTDVISKENVFAQVTVRFHTQQTLAIYDRFGRLMHGSEILAKDVLEYIVFEKHLANEYGVWRVHGKIIPEWMPPKEPSLKTYKKIITNEVKEIAAPETQSKELTA